MSKKSKRSNNNGKDFASQGVEITCSICTFVNEFGAVVCTVCDSPLLALSNSSSSSSLSTSAPSDRWTCDQCTYINAGPMSACEMCTAKKGIKAAPVNLVIGTPEQKPISTKPSTITLEISFDSKIRKVTLFSHPSFDDLCLATRILYGDGWYEFQQAGKNIEKNEHIPIVSSLSVVALRDNARSGGVLQKHTAMKPSSPACAVISEPTKYFACATCNVRWVCESCILGCHDAHKHAVLGTIDRPLWGVCRCFRGGECLHEVEMVRQQDVDWTDDKKENQQEAEEDWEGGFVDTADDTMLSNVGGGLGVHQSVIDETRIAVQRDIYELNQLQMFQASADMFALESNKFSVRLGMNLALLNLSKEQALAWYLNLDKLLVVQIDFSAYYFDSVVPPTIVIVGLADSLTGVIEPCRLSWTLKNRLKNVFLKHHSEKQLRPYEIDDVKSLMDITSESFFLCLLALQEKKGNIAQATTLLTDQRQELLQKIYRKEGLEFKGRATGFMEGVKQALFGTSMSSHDKDRQQLCDSHGISGEVADLVLEVEPNVSAAILLLSHPEVKQQFVSMTKRSRPSADARTEIYFGKLFGQHNILVRMMRFLCERMKLVNKTCLICDEPLEYEGLRPDVCSKPLCVMGYESFELGFSLAQEIKDAPEVTDLLISFLVAAINANRLLFVTPTGVQIKKKDGTIYSYLNSKGDLDTARIKASLERLPSVAEMQQLAARYELSEHLNRIDVLLAPLVRWIITSNRAHIRLLQPHEQIKQMGTAHQFVMLSATPEKEHKFLDLRDRAEVKKGKGKGALWAFHGSSTGNWHSILRTGLKNLSNTKYMTAGAAYGPGIYMGLNSSTSMGYCGVVPGWSKSRYGASFSCMALCEVVNADSGINKHSGIYVVPDDDIVNTRFLFVAPNGSVDVNSITIPKLA